MKKSAPLFCRLRGKYYICIGISHKTLTISSMKNFIIVRQHITDFGWESEIIATYESEEQARQDLSRKIRSLTYGDSRIAIRELIPFDNSVVSRIGWLSSGPSTTDAMGQFLIVNLNRLQS